MGKCEISRKGRSPRELNFLRQLQICAFPQPRRGVEPGGVAGNPAPTAAPAGPQPPDPEAAGFGLGLGGAASPPRGPRRGPGNLLACKTARHSRAVADALVNNRTFIFPPPLSFLHLFFFLLIFFLIFLI